MSLTEMKTSPLFAPTVGTDLHFISNRDAAILQVVWDPQSYVAVSYSDILEGDEIGVAGYPLPQMVTPLNGGQPMFRFVFRVAKGVITSTIKQGLRLLNEPPTIELQTVEVNFLFAPGNSGGPIFESETGRVVAYVEGFSDSQIAQRYSDTNQDNIVAGAPAKYVEVVHAVYSLGIKLDSIRTELEGFGVAL
jgi:hypothetical protein